MVLEHNPGPGEASRAQQFTTNHPSTQTETTAARLCPKLPLSRQGCPFLRPPEAQKVLVHPVLEEW